MSPLLQESPEDRAEAGGLVKGVAVAIVTNNRDEAGMARVRVRFPWRPEGESAWARLAVPMAGADRGTYFLPEVGDEVLVAFDRGDMRSPYVLGALWNGQDRPPAQNGDGQNRIRRIRTPVGHEVTFDEGGERSIEIVTAGKKRILLDDHGLHIADERGNEVHIDSDGGGLLVKSQVGLRLQSQQIELDAGTSLTLKATGTVTIQGALVRIN